MAKRTNQPQAPAQAVEPVQTPRLKEAVLEARIESAERSGVVVDLRDAELARLELLNELLDPVFADVPEGIELFERGISHGVTPRLWVDVVAHVVMGRDKRLYRFVQDTRHGRKVLIESFEPGEIAAAVTRYVAHRLVEHERAVAETPASLMPQAVRDARSLRRRRRWRAIRAFVFGLVVGIAALLTAAWWTTPSP
jgi:hypothetical protein